MKRIHWLTLLGVSGTGLAALLLGQSVLGQPETKMLPPPSGAVQPETPAPKRSADKPAGDMEAVQAPTFPPAPPSAPLFPSPPGNPPIEAEIKITRPIDAPPPAPLKIENGLPQKQFVSPVSLEVQPGRQQPSVTIEWAAPAAVRINQPMPCQIVVRNSSATPAQNVIVRHRLGQGVVCKATEPAAGNDGGELVWNLGTLLPEQTRRIDLTLLSPTRGPLNCHAVVTFSAVAAHQVQVREPQLAVKMTAPDKAIVGENVTLLFAISNPGDGLAEGVKLKTTLPDGFEHPRGKVVEFEVGNLAPKENKVVQLICQTRSGGAQKCTINVTGDGGLLASDSTQIDILVPKLEVAMSGPKIRYLDRHAVYVLKVSNPGSAPATGVEVHELIPSGFKFHQASAGGQYQEATRLVSWSLGDLQPGQTKDVTVNLIPIESGVHRVTAQARAALGLKSETDIRTSVEGISSLFIEVGHVDDPIEVGAETAYEIRLANNGTKLETNVEVICTIPEQLEFRGAKCSTALRFRQEGRELIFEPLPRLAPKADVIYRVQVRGVAPGDIRFRTRVKSDSLKEPVMREECTRVYSDEGPVRPSTSVPSIPNSSTPTPLPTPTPSELPGAPSLPAPNSRPLETPGLPAPRSEPGLLPSEPSIPPLSSTPATSPMPIAPPSLPSPPSPAPSPPPLPPLPANP